MTKLKYLVAITAAITLAGCAGDTSAPLSGTIAVRLTDAPFSVDSVRSADIFVVRVDGRVADADSSTAAQGAADDSAQTNGWVTIAQPASSINLLSYQNGQSIAIGQTSLAAGTYQGFRIVIDPTKSSVTLKDGRVLSGSSSPGIVFPSGARSGIKIILSQPVTIGAGQTTTLVVDFDLANSFTLRGNSISQNGLLFKPVVRATVTAS